MTIPLPTAPANPAQQYQATALDEWPQQVTNGTCVEPISGAVRVLRPKLPPIEIDTAAARELARRARNDGDIATLFAAAREGDRQAEMFKQLMERK